MHSSVRTALSQYTGNVLHAVLGALAVRWFAGSPPRLDDLQSMAAFVLLAAIAAPAIASIATVYLSTLTSWTSDYWLVLQQRILSQILGTITVTPLLLLVIPRVSAAWPKMTLSHYVELGLLTIGLLAVGIPVFGWNAPGSESFPGLLFAPLPSSSGPPSVSDRGGCASCSWWSRCYHYRTRLLGEGPSSRTQRLTMSCRSSSF